MCVIIIVLYYFDMWLSSYLVTISLILHFWILHSTFVSTLLFVFVCVAIQLSLLLFL